MILGVINAHGVGGVDTKNVQAVMVMAVRNALFVLALAIKIVIGVGEKDM